MKTRLFDPLLLCALITRARHSVRADEMSNFARRSGLALRPILDAQLWNMAEFLVGAHKGQPVSPGDGRDLEVVGPDHPALNLQLVPDLGIVPGGRIVKRERRERRKEHVQGAPPPLAIAIFLRAMPQLRLDHGAQENVRDGLRLDPSVEFAARILQQGNPYIGVRQEGHYHASRFSNSPCGGRWKGSLPNSRATRVKKSAGNRSGRAAPFWVSTSSKASRTSFSREDAALASSVFNFASNSSAMTDITPRY